MSDIIAAQHIVYLDPLLPHPYLFRPSTLHHNALSLISSTFNNPSMSLRPSTLPYHFDLQQLFHTTSTFDNPSMSLQPSTTLPYLFDLQQPFHTTSTFIPPIPFRPSTILPCLFRPPILPHLFDLSHTHAQSRVRWLYVTRFRKMRKAWGLEGSAQ